MTDQKREAYDAARQYAWNWFEYHAAQRQSVFRFFLIMTAFVSTGYVTAIVKEFYSISTILAILLVVISFLFWRLDSRSIHLVKIAEYYLEIEETRLKDSIGQEKILLVTEAEKRPYDKNDKMEKPAFIRSLKELHIFFKYLMQHKIFPYCYSFRQVYQIMFIVIGSVGVGGFFYAVVQ